MQKKRIVMLAGDGASTSILFHALDQEFWVEKVILEEGVPMGLFLKRRIRSLGLVTVFGQILFKICIVPLLERAARARRQEIFQECGLNDSVIPAEQVLRVPSANDQGTIDVLIALKPDIVVINGTRILSKKLLTNVSAVFVNMHAGITPLYRGVHGAYWALVQKKPEVCGVTVHLVDPGIDTGGILKQAIIHPTENDSFVTYPFLQLAAGIPLLKEAIKELAEGKSKTLPNPEGESALWSHPTLWGYVWRRIVKKVK